jgi:hypothetical protein
MSQSIEVPIATGELIDKITILEIKVARFTDPAKLANAQAELSLLRQRRDAALASGPVLDALTLRLRAANECIWDLENIVRQHERRQQFGADFAAVARQTYRTNDERAALKREISVLSGSALIEEKSHSAT